MSDNQKINLLADTSLPSRIFICLFLADEQFTQGLTKLLSSDRYRLQEINLAGEFFEFIENHKEQIDCLVCLKKVSIQPLLSRLSEQGVLLPIVIIDRDCLSNASSPTTINNEQDEDNDLSEKFNYQEESTFFKESASLSNLSDSDFGNTNIYHSAEVIVPWSNIEQINNYIDLAITKFLNLAPSCSLTKEVNQTETNYKSNSQHFLLLQQRRLAEKLKERLGYLGVYYKRNPQDFYRNSSPQKKQAIIQELSADYRQIILDYFAENPEMNQLIDQFVNQAFFADLSVSQILEIHMELMDEFAQQLKLEGRSEEILLDYRLVLIDIIAHLCEMYRRSIPREDIAFELLFRVD
jgi:circadian clock protein KaiA